MPPYRTITSNEEPKLWLFWFLCGGKKNRDNFIEIQSSKPCLARLLRMIISAYHTKQRRAKLLKPKQKEQEDLLSPVLDKENLSAEEMLDEYKAQQSCERGFRFIKDPLFLADSVLVKTPKRIETMVFFNGNMLISIQSGTKNVKRGTTKERWKSYAGH